MILIITKLLTDTTVVSVRELLEAQGQEVVVLSQEVMEQNASFRINRAADGTAQAILRLAEREINFATDVSAAWIWRSWRPEPLLERYQQLAKQHDEWNFFSGEWGALYKGIVLAIKCHNIFCINPPPFHDAFEEKCAQLWVAADVGFNIPDTLFTAHLPYAQDFYEQHADSIIYKPFRPFFKMIPAKDEEPSKIAKLLTNRVSKQHFSNARNAVPTPGIFQPYVDKAFELRIVVVGREIFACSIHSQSSERAREDWRRYDIPNTPHQVYALPDDLAAKVRNYMDRLQLVFGSIDMIVTPEGEHIFLEINPNGQFDWIARLTGMPIYEHFAAMLQAASIDYPIPLAQEAVNAQ
ncbi:hypothetical protein [Herpetosiphon sp. NSE202]|uniref:hypothetical protein n=1 Tax=Herpetosiphon sp. NSE202 TaxID=3351349 RepID=UPI0036371C59